MLGNKYLRYYPSGLARYRSCLKNANETRGVVCCPHKVFTEIEFSYHISKTTFLSDQYELFKERYQVNPDTSLLHENVKSDYFDDVMVSEENEDELNPVKLSVKPSQNNVLVRSFKMFQEIENAAENEIFYR